MPNHCCAVSYVSMFDHTAPNSSRTFKCIQNFSYGYALNAVWYTSERPHRIRRIARVYQCAISFNIHFYGLFSCISAIIHHLRAFSSFQLYIPSCIIACACVCVKGAHPCGYVGKGRRRYGVCLPCTFMSLITH